MISCVTLGTAVARAEPASPIVTTVFENDFDSEYDPNNWTTAKRRNDAAGNGYLVMQTWLLQFSRENLPEHKYARARIRMMMFGSVEGAPAAGPTDFWSLSLANGPTLFRSAFQMREKDKRGVLDGFGSSVPGRGSGGAPSRRGRMGLLEFRMGESKP